MIPSSNPASTPVSVRAWSSIARACTSSSSVATIGSITLTGKSAATRRIARSCVASTSGRASEDSDSPHAQEGIGFAGSGSAGSGLSAPASSVRITSGRPSSADAIARRVLTCSSSCGNSARSRYRNSVRSRPTPSAPSDTARAASAGLPRLATISTRTPSRVPALGPRQHRRAPLRSVLVALLGAVGDGLRRLQHQRPLVSVHQHRGPTGDLKHRFAQAHDRRQTQGAGEIAACAVAAPWAVAIPVTSRLQRRRVGGAVRRDHDPA